jgi:hypothetical protein
MSGKARIFYIYIENYEIVKQTAVNRHREDYGVAFLDLDSQKLLILCRYRINFAVIFDIQISWIHVFVFHTLNIIKQYFL